MSINPAQLAALFGPNVRVVFQTQADQSPFEQTMERAQQAGKQSEDNEEYINLLSQLEELLKEDPTLVNKSDPQFLVTPLHTAAGAGLLKMVQLFLKFNPDTDLMNCFGQTPAERARKFAKREDIAELIENADPSLD